ncbi:serine hydrolase domain-containing protein [Sungkyunkwania multivorans]|uniref:Serine hydrolase domain-containing protein n=1 Tax=Sungkyunkwania multivorans TaxID=1173618 RepID=A0ABW3D2H9_9FLAO
MKRLFYSGLIGLFFIGLGHAQSQADALTTKLNKIQDLGYLPGFAVAVVSEKGVHYQNGFGYSDVENKRPFTVNSLQNIGSISKTLTGIAIMKLIEEGKLSLETPINDILPQKLYNPYYPKIPITIRHLVTHTASFNDPFDYERTYLFSEKINIPKKRLPKELRKYVKLYNTNTPMSVEQFIESMMHPFGKYYAKKNFLRKRPGTTYNYSNMGATIAGYIVELVSGKSYQDYTREHVLNPLNMTRSGWSHEEIDMSNFVSLYLRNDEKIPPYSLISYADGGLITSVHDLSLYFSEMIKGYKNGNSKILSDSSYKTMMDALFISDDKKSGIFWAINGKGEYGHSGGDPGIMAYMMFDPKTGLGRIVLTNKFDDKGNGINQVVYIWKTLEEFMSGLAAGL